MTAEFVFDRRQELQALRELILERRPLLIHGPAAVGKTLLLRTVLAEFPDVLYCPDSRTMLNILRVLATALLQRGSARILRASGRHGPEGVASRSAVALKGIVLDALRGGHFAVALDHVACPAASYAATVREFIGWASTPVIAVARSAHMEDIGSLHRLFSDRRDRFELRNFNPATAKLFARDSVARAGLSAENMDDFLREIHAVSKGNPGAILTLVEMAKLSKYRSADHIKLAPLGIDFRLEWRSGGS
jgi:hypothetical protein